MKIEYHTNGKALSEHHFKTGATRWSIGEKSEEIESDGLFMHKGELEKPMSQMEIGIDLDDDGVGYMIPADDPLRNDISLLVSLNAFVASIDEDKKAEQRLYELARQGAPLDSCYKISEVITQIGPGFLLIEKRPKKGILSSLILDTDKAKDTLCTVAQGRDECTTALTARNLPFDENSPEELAAIQKIREEIRQERRNQTTLFRLLLLLALDS